MLIAGIISSAALVLIAAIIVQAGRGENRKPESGRRRILLAMCVGAGIAFSLVYFEWDKAIFLPTTENGFLNMLAVAMTFPLLWLLLGFILGLVAAPAALLFKKLAPLKVQENLASTLVVGAMVGAVISLALANFANMWADPDNPFAFRPDVIRTVLACSFAGTVGAFIWWSGMRNVRND